MLYLAAVINLLVGIVLVGACISVVVEADKSLPPALPIILAVPGIFFLYWGIRAAADQIKAEKQEALASLEEARRKAHQNAEAARWEARARAQADAEERAALEAEVEHTWRMELRDADSQDTPYEYQCIGHPNVTLALRYGIANTSRNAGSEGGRENATISIQKIKKIRHDEPGAQYLAVLPDFGGRQVKVVIRPGAEFVLTFLPISDTWFNEHEDLERLLKDNPTFTLKELATFHVQAVLNAKR